MISDELHVQTTGLLGVSSSACSPKAEAKTQPRSQTYDRLPSEAMFLI